MEENSRLDETISCSEMMLAAIEDQIKQNELKQLESRSLQVNAYGEEYEPNFALREMFPNSYFLEDIFDEAICGVDLNTSSIIYEWEDLGYLIAINTEGTSGDLLDRIEFAVKEISRVEKLSQEELQGKVKPTFLFPTWKMDMDNWEQLKYRI